METGDYIFNPTSFYAPEGVAQRFREGGAIWVEILTPHGQTRFMPIRGYHVLTAQPDAMFIAERRQICRVGD